MRYAGIALSARRKRKRFSDSHIEGCMGSRPYKTPSVPAEHDHTSRPPRKGVRGNAMPYDEERRKRPGKKMNEGTARTCSERNRE